MKKNYHVKSVKPLLRFIFIGFITGLLFISIPGLYASNERSEAAATTGWEGLAGSNIEHGVGGPGIHAYPSLDVDSKGNPHIAWLFWDNSSNPTKYYIYYKYWDGSQWSTLGGSANVSKSGNSWFPTLRLDSMDYPHIAWNTSNNTKAAYTYWDGSQWAVLNGSKYLSIPRDVSRVQMELDSSDHPHITYRSWPERQIYYRYWNGTQWRVLGSEKISNISYDCDSPSLALNSTNRPYITFHARTTYYGNRIYCKYWNGSSWQYLRNPPYGLGTISSLWPPSPIKVGTDNIAQVISKSSSSKSIYYRKWNGSGWTVGTVPQPSTNYVSSPQIVLDSLNNPHISWLRDSYSNKVYYVYRDGSSWKSPDDDPWVGRQRGSLPSLALDSNDVPHIAFTAGYEGSSKVYYLTYTGGSSTTIQPPANLIATDTPLDNGGSIQLDWSLSPDDARVDGYKIFRATEPGGYNFDLPLAAVTAGTSAYTDNTTNDNQTYYYVVRAYKDAVTSEVSNEASGVSLDNLPPAAPTGLNAVPSIDYVTLSWNANTDSDLAGYNVYRSTTSGSGYALLATVTNNSYIDSGLTNWDTYYYVVKAFDEVPNESSFSNEATAVSPQGQSGDIIEDIVDLPPDAFSNPNNSDQRKNALTEKLNEVIALIDTGQYQLALDKLQNDILSKTDGCYGGNPNNDWITDCTAQAIVYPAVVDLIELLESLI